MPAATAYPGTCVGVSNEDGCTGYWVVDWTAWFCIGHKNYDNGRCTGLY